jgi:hypothetical protein
MNIISKRGIKITFHRRQVSTWSSRAREISSYLLLFSASLSHLFTLSFFRTFFSLYLPTTSAAAVRVARLAKVKRWSTLISSD